MRLYMQYQQHTIKGEFLDISMEKKHSGPGIASFITSIVSGLLLFVLFVIAGMIEVSTPGGMDEHSAEAIIIGFIIIFLVLTSLIALGLGIGGLCQKERKKIFAILGTTISTLMILGTLALIAIGAAVG